MTDATTLTAAQVLAIPAAEPERLFTGAATAEAEFRALARRWHPDRNPDPQAADVFAHLATLRRAAQDRIAAGIWNHPGLLTLTRRDGTTCRLAYKKRHVFELGDLYIAPTAAAFVLKPGNEDLFDTAVRVLRGFRFATDSMQTEVARQLPEVTDAFLLPKGAALVVAKRPDQVLLRDLLDLFGGRLDPRHAAWVLSSLHNLACYLGWAGLSHNAIAPDTVFVSPEKHDAALLGGWWYAAPVGAGLVALPARTAALAPAGLLAAKIADRRVDLDLIRALGRELLGDPGGTRLLRDATVPRPLADWLRLPTGGNAIRDYELWQQVLNDSFGARRFVKLPVTASDIYP